MAGTRWWTERDEQIGHAVCEVASSLIETLRTRHEIDLRHARLYGGAEFAGLLPWSYSRIQPASDRLALNVIASCVDTATAKLAKSRPVPQFLTNGADYSTRRKAAKLNKFGKGLLMSGFYELAPLIMRDGCVFGTGIAKVYGEPDEKKICFERVYPWELLVDPLESAYGEPRTFIQRKWVDRQVLLEAYGSGRGAQERIRAIESSQTPPEASRWAPGRDPQADQVEVFEAWHLRSGRNASDGKHVIAVRGGTLLAEDYERDRAPFVVFRWSDPIGGFWGIGIAERLTGIQVEINRLLRVVQESMRRLGVPRVILDAASGIPKSHVTNDIAAILVNNGGSPPIVIPPQTVHPETFAQIDRLYQRAFEEVGISQLAAQSRKPAGLDSGAALREFNDIESERFLVAGRRWESLHLDVVRVGIECAREIPGFSIDVPDARDPASLSWADVDLDRSAYVLQCFPASILPSTPAGRIQTVQELLGAGLISQTRAMELLDVPDLEDFYGAQNASRRVVRRTIERMLDGDAYEPPDPRIDLASAVELGNAAYLEAVEHQAPEEVLEVLRRWVDECVALMQQAQAAAQPPAPAQPSPEEMMGVMPPA